MFIQQMQLSTISKHITIMQAIPISTCSENQVLRNLRIPSSLNQVYYHTHKNQVCWDRGKGRNSPNQHQCPNFYNQNTGKSGKKRELRRRRRIPVSSFANLFKLLEAIDTTRSPNRRRLLEIQLPKSSNRHFSYTNSQFSDEFSEMILDSPLSSISLFPFSPAFPFPKVLALLAFGVVGFAEKT